MYASIGRPSIPPEKLLRAQLLQMLYTIRSERLLMEEMDYNIFALTFSTSIWDVPRNLGNSLRAMLYLPAYVIRHAAQWLNVVTPAAIVAAIWLLFIALRRLRKRPATEDEDTLR